MLDIEEVLGPEGILSSHLDGFSYRPQQQAMAQQVADVLSSDGVLITEAGTGTGKTFAYLVPALLSGKKVIISTGTRNLQDQLFHRDLPFITEALAIPADVALLKGRSNYLCIHRMENALLEGRFRSRDQVNQLLMVKRWAQVTHSGDVAELKDVPEDTPIWPWVTSTTDNCLGQECLDYSKCHLMEARKRAQEADLVVINHHLLCADFSLKEGGFGELLPSADCFVIDEAHQLPEVASNFFGSTISGRQLQELVKDTEAEYLQEAGDMPEIPEQAASLGKAVRDLRLVFGVDSRRGPWRDVGEDERFVAAMEKVRTELGGLHDLLNAIEGRGKGIDSCLGRAAQLITDLSILCDEQPDDEIRWYETQRHSFRLNRTPLDISDLFKTQMEGHPGSWVFTSATLAVDGEFDHFRHQLGLDKAETACWDSPFDYPEQALWFVPRGLPEPRNPDYISQAAEQVMIPALKASHGRAFLLFTSHRALREAADLLEDAIDYPLLVQGRAAKGELIDQFRSHGNAVLLGTASFWEGVDVRGEALSMVVIDKLPFASPGDPVLQARIDALKKQGGNPFWEFQLPQATIALKQGAGRLIRDASDRGVLIICDPRLLKKQYGHVFLNSMPAMARTRDITDVERFFNPENHNH